MSPKTLLTKVIQMANSYGRSNYDFNVKLVKFEDNGPKGRKDFLAIVKCWNDGDEEDYRVKVRVLPETVGEFHLLEIQHEGGEPQIVGASGHALCAILYA